jgi:L-rhamnose mutarotase
MIGCQEASVDRLHGDGPMSDRRRYASVIGLRPEHEEEYRRMHTEVWPGVLGTITRCGVRNYSIYLRDGLLFSYLEYVGDDYEADMAVMAADPDTQRWWEIMDPFQRRLDDAPTGSWWTPMEEVFHID